MREGKPGHGKRESLETIEKVIEKGIGDKKKKNKERKLGQRRDRERNERQTI